MRLNFFRTHKQFTIFALLALLVIGVAIFAPLLAPMNPLEASMDDSLQPPGGKYLCGADKFGRDVLSCVIYGTRTSLLWHYALLR